jgi:GNAT superfamily N-acetyltransferase
MQNLRAMVSIVLAECVTVDSDVVPVARDTYQLSMTGVGSAQGKGLGKRLIEPTLADADAEGVDCWLETFEHRDIRFYQRLGFPEIASHLEPLTGATYAITCRAAQIGTGKP